MCSDELNPEAEGLAKGQRSSASRPACRDKLVTRGTGGNDLISFCSSRDEIETMEAVFFMHEVVRLVFLLFCVECGVDGFSSNVVAS